MTLVSAYLFVNDGRLDTENAQKLLLDTSLAFHVLASQCYEALHGCYAPASVKPRLFLDSGIELESFEGFEGGESILIVSSGEAFRPYDHLRKLFTEAVDFGWLQGADLPAFFDGLYSAASLEEEGAAEDHLPWFSDDVRRIIATALPKEHRDGFLANGEAPAWQPNEHEVLSTMPRLQLSDQLLVDEAAVTKMLDAAVPAPLDRLTSRSPLRGEPTSSTAQSASTSTVTEAETTTGSWSGSGLGTDPAAAAAAADGDGPADTPGRFEEGTRSAVVNRRYRDRINIGMNKLREMMPRPGTEQPVTKATTMERAAKYILALQKEKAVLGDELEALNKELARERERLLTEHRRLHYRMVGVVITQLLVPVNPKSVAPSNLYPRNTKWPFFATVVYWNHVMELVTGWSAKEAFGRATFDVYGFYRNTYVRQSYFYYLKNAPLPQTDAAYGHRSVLIVECKDGQMLKAVAYGYPITDPRTGLRTHGLGLFTNFRPFNPIEIP